MRTSFFLIIGVLVLSGCGSDGIRPDEPVACTLDAKVCPDGSAVGRTGPDCAFAPCPNEETLQVKGEVTTNPEE